jgi:2,4-dienoyl-CoA reductase-like NADH-dependent reductase (Old Yellow Enzyme family)
MDSIPTGYATENGEVTPKMVEYYTERARAGVGIIMIENAYISEEGKNFENQLGIHKDTLISSLKYLVKRIKEEGSAAGLNIGYRSEKPLYLFEIKELIKKYFLSLKRARESGVDLVEIEDIDLKTKMEFKLEILKEIRNMIGYDYPIFYRVNPEKYKEEEAVNFFLKEIKEEIDGIDISDFPKEKAINLGREIKKNFKNKLVVLKGSGENISSLEKFLKEKNADIISLGRELLADPEWCRKVKAKREDKIIKCKECEICNYHRDGCPQEISSK